MISATFPSDQWVKYRLQCVFIFILLSAAGPSGASTSADPQSSGNSSSAPSHNFPEADVKRLTDYGFSLNQVITELTKAQGNVDQALAALFAQSFQVPS